MQPNQPLNPQLIQHHIDLNIRRTECADAIKKSYVNLASVLGEYSKRSVPAEKDVIAAAITVLHSLAANVKMDLDILAVERHGMDLALKQATSHIVLPTMRGN